MKSEILWKKIENYNYSVSSEGVVKLHKPLKLRIKNNTHVVTLTSKGQKGVTRRVDELVAEAFIGPKLPEHEIFHIDGNYENDCKDNLVWLKTPEYLLRVHTGEWRRIKDVEGIYYICKDGRVWSKATDSFISMRIHVGYPSVKIGYPKRIFVHLHVLLARAFIWNSFPDERNVVNHIDEDVTNYSLENLEWCTQLENVLHSIKPRSPRPVKEKIPEPEGVELEKGYVVCRDGQIYSKSSKFYLTQTPNGSGYPRVEIKGVKKFVHHLVADSFLPPHPTNDGEVYEIDHINGTKTDNRVENLEWVTKSEQMKRCAEMYSDTFLKSRKAVVQMTMDGVKVKNFPGIKEAARQTQINSGSIVKACKGDRPSAGGYKWKYK